MPDHLLTLLASALLIALAPFSSSGCFLLSPPQSEGCEDFASSCVCPGGSMGAVECDQELNAIVACDCSQAMRCASSARALCRCDGPRRRIGLTACEDQTFCSCEEIAAPPESEGTQLIPKLPDGLEVAIDGRCDELDQAPRFPASGFANFEDHARMSCQLAWQTIASGGAQLLGCCQVPDDHIWTRASMEDTETLDRDLGDDRLKLSLQGATNAFHQITLSAAAIHLVTRRDGAMISLEEALKVSASSRISGAQNDAAQLDTGYTLEWSVELAEAQIAPGQIFGCQLSRFDVLGGDPSALTLGQEHAFGADATLPATQQLGECLLVEQ